MTSLEILLLSLLIVSHIGWYMAFRAYSELVVRVVADEVIKALGATDEQ